MSTKVQPSAPGDTSAMLRLGEGLFRNFEWGSDYLEQVDELIAGLEARPTGLGLRSGG